MSIKAITILGDGGWGTAIALLLTGKGYAVQMWGHDPKYLEEMNKTKENKKFLPGFPLPPELKFEAELKAACADAEVMVVAIPTKFLRLSFTGRVNSTGGMGSMPPLKGVLKDNAAVVSLVKGIEEVNMARPSEIIAEAFGIKDVAVLSGPSHAEEVAKGLPATVVVASENKKQAKLLQEVFMTPALRVYTSDDVIGVELGGALKNVMAVAVGICEGLGLGDNARAALMTRGLAEMARMGIALGAKPETFAGLSGVGDLITTCVSPHGRNRAVGLALAKGKKLKEILAATETVAEGITACISARELAQKHKIEMPITEALYSILYDNTPPRETVGKLMNRSPKAE
ncbi:MAG: NAD(P)-dependent glycerol-3-phosphate dehydrogenase [Planctomycetes bacterium]|nr:NAD(P)-dependent glycerol-3-phosphate dehydrogenase [Planctomycetota bacterium]